ncbi:hypothetical protein [Holdemania massiliensis]|uniref:XRE family transcriptional regulator n=1 Tax=Holdemania massiliensis TaxID=1468449 RepID=A0A6N7S6L4_9FIRM|nr:hypothetical protein [Holdemania massiliensis]MSA70959.1 hypothetical protein [Holdemania massiliensis]MSA89285.1 hypothetical protein [Holdemania massiliensis]MSB78038.1 hypothetical protein [Holdemania massiliensis]MSC32963.1 hypothetical protein [Holdemania massiliensis]MSC39360.1 hypothetical protein [Holdemania massiliensis]
MTLQQQIKMALTYKGMSLTELAAALNMTPQAFNQRMRTAKFTKQELIDIAGIIGCQYVCYFEFPDGTKI